METLELTTLERAELVTKALCTPRNLRPLAPNSGIDHEIRGQRLQIVRDGFDHLVVKSYKGRIEGQQKNGYFVLVDSFKVDPEQYAIEKNILKSKILDKLREIEDSLKYFDGSNNKDLQEIVDDLTASFVYWNEEFKKLN